MLFDIESFVSETSIRALMSLKRPEVIQVMKQYNLTVTSGMKKGEGSQLIVSYLRDKGLVCDDGDFYDNTVVTLKKLEQQERAKESEAEVKCKELQLKKEELEMQLRLRKLEFSWNTVSSDAPVEAKAKSPIFNVSRHIKFVPSFSVTEVDRYFLFLRKWNRA